MPYFTLIGNIRCFECGENVPFEIFEDHMIRFHGYVKCSLCNQVFSLQRLEEHKNRYHQVKEYNISNIFKCVECDTEIHLFEKHEKTICTECELLISAKSILYHLKEIHGYVICEICRTPVKPSDLKDHMNVHDMSICPACSSFYSNQVLDCLLYTSPSP